MPVASLGMSDAIAQQLRSEILRGEISGGDRLRQDHIAARFGASHVPVREALQKLGAEGLVLFQPRRGAMVTPLTMEDAQEITDIRIELECLALKKAITMFPVADYESAQQAIRKGNEAEDLDQLMSANWDFHQSIYAGEQQPRLMKSLDALWLHNERYQRLVFETIPYKLKSQQEHADILAAVEAGKSDEAVDLLAQHINEGGAMMIQILKKRLP
ncbi:GntR family transcriptional regulator [Kiloniella sp. EL199]|uniref:GntR family transcriptional regulator n=1 Tax=Kiloniella sp. EL199 TaxID=2107581 RepID=UPI0013C47767|nr:GntR family transcriptional regulator [Kiloniella sp. EL199]